MNSYLCAARRFEATSPEASFRFSFFAMRLA
jgi:hypothetical protein